VDATEADHDQEGAQSIDTYLNRISVLADEIVMSGKPVDDDDLVFLTLDGLGPDLPDW